MLPAWEAIIWLPVNCVTMSSPRNWERQAVRGRTTQEKLLSLAVMYTLRAGMTYDRHTLTEDRSNSFHSLTVCGRRRHFRTLETDGYINMALNKLHFCGESKLFPDVSGGRRRPWRSPPSPFLLKVTVSLMGISTGEYLYLEPEYSFTFCLFQTFLTIKDHV